MDDARATLAIQQAIIPVAASNRPGKRMVPQGITVHSTANRGPGADAIMHARYVNGPEARQRKVSWHFTVDDRRAMQHLPVNEVGMHAGTSDGNATTIGVEVCEHAGIDQGLANERAALLVALLAVENGIPLSRVRTHKSWTGKDCPGAIFRSPGGWDYFLTRVRHHMGRLA